MPGHSEKIGFIGAGNMAEAIIGATISAGIAPAGNIYISDIDPERTNKLEALHQITILPANTAIVNECDTIFFAVKPQQVKSVLQGLAADGAFEIISGKKRVVSIAAGTRMATYENIIYEKLPAEDRYQFPIIRVMPNTPALVSAGTSALCANDYASTEDLDIIRKILGAMGKFFECPESDMNAFTAVAGSGPAYGFYLIEAMTDAGIELGLARKEALDMTVSTLKGALKLLEAKKTAPEILRRNVTSPGGTTEAAIAVMENHKVKSVIIEAVVAAARRAAELSK